MELVRHSLETGITNFETAFIGYIFSVNIGKIIEKIRIPNEFSLTIFKNLNWSIGHIFSSELAIGPSIKIDNPRMIVRENCIRAKKVIFDDFYLLV